MSVSRKGELLHGQQFNPRDPGVVPYTQQMMDDASAAALVGNDATEIIPVDAQNCEVKIFDVSAIQTILDEYVTSSPSFTSFNLPDVLVSLEAFFNSSTGDGFKTTDSPTAVTGGTSGSMDITLSNSAQGSASVIADLIPTIKQTVAQNVPSTIYVVYMPEVYTFAQLQTKLAGLTPPVAILPWPDFSPQSASFIAYGSQYSISQSATSANRFNWGSGNSSFVFYPYGSGNISEGASVESGVTVKNITLPPTIHGDVAILPYSTASFGATVTVKADIPSIIGTGSAPTYPAITNHPTPLTATANGGIYPTSVNATPGTTAIPTSGKYVKSINTEVYSYGRSLVQLEVVDFSYFAP